MTKNLLLILIIFVTVISCSFGQNSNKNRLEFDVGKLKEEHHVIPIGESGVILIRKGGKEFKGNVFVLEKYNADFKKEWNKKIPNPGSMKLTKYIGTDEFLYALLIGYEGNKYVYKVIQVDIEEGSFKNIIGKVKSVEINELYANGKQVFFGGKLKEGMMSYRGILYYVDFETMESSETPIEFEKYSEVVHINKPKEGLINVVVENTDHPSMIRKLNVREYKGIGDNYEAYKIEPNSMSRLKDGRIISTSNNERIVIGSYSKSYEQRKGIPKMEKYPAMLTGKDAVNAQNLYSNGFYFAKVKDAKQEYIKYFPFEKFKNFLVTGTDQEIAQLKKKIGKGEKVTLDYELLLHDIIKIKDQYVLVAEAYYYWWNEEKPLRLESNYQDDGSGCRHTHAIVVAFDGKGELLWDNIFKIEEITSPVLEKRVTSTVVGDNLILSYNNAGTVYTQVFKNGKIILEKSGTKIAGVKKSDEIKRSAKSNVVHWYDNHFIAYGFQKIVNEELPKKDKKRLVFYLNKMDYE